MFERLCYYRSLVYPLQRLAHIHHLLQGLSGIRKKRNLIKECFFEKASTRARKHRQHQTTRKHANTQTRTLNQSPHKQACANSIPTHTFENNGTTFHAQSAHAHDKQQLYNIQTHTCHVASSKPWYYPTIVRVRVRCLLQQLTQHHTSRACTHASIPVTSLLVQKCNSAFHTLDCALQRRIIRVRVRCCFQQLT